MPGHCINLISGVASFPRILFNGTTIGTVANYLRSRDHCTMHRCGSVVGASFLRIMQLHRFPVVVFRPQQK
jgi:hypothetical protein